MSTVLRRVGRSPVAGWCALLLVAAACRRSTHPAGSATTGGPQGRVRWTAEIGGGVYPDGPVIGLDGATIYTAGSVVATEDDLGRPAQAGARRLALLGLDTTGRIVRTLPGSLTGMGVKMWVRMAPWGTAYAIDSQGGLYGMFTDGSQHYRFVGVHLSGPPAIADNGRLFAGANRATLGFDLQGDGPASSRLEAGSFGLPPVVARDGMMYMGALHGVAAVDASGDTRWTARAMPAAPVLDDQDQVYFVNKNRLVALDNLGAERWRYEGPDDLTVPVLSPEGVMIVVGAAGLVQAVGLDGQQRWTFTLATAPWSPVGVGPDGTVYMSDRQSRLVAVAPGGKQRWSIKLPAPSARPTAAADGTVYVECTDGRLFAITGP